MSRKAEMKRDLDAADHQTAVFGKRVGIIANSDSDHTEPCFGLPVRPAGRRPDTRRVATIASASSRSAGVVTLMFSSEPKAIRTHPPNLSTKAASSVP